MLSIGTSYTAGSKHKPLSGGSKTKWYRVVINRFDNILDAQNAWDQFQQENRGRDETSNQRYIRLNPVLKSKVKLDDVKSLEELKRSVDTCLKSPQWKADTRAVARRLIASSFFFEEDPKFKSEDSIQGNSYAKSVRAV
jgi:hypothetical protein